MGEYSPKFLRKLKKAGQKEPPKFWHKVVGTVGKDHWTRYMAMKEVAVNGSTPKDYYQVLNSVIKQKSIFSFSFVRHPFTRYFSDIVHKRDRFNLLNPFEDFVSTTSIIMKLLT